MIFFIACLQVSHKSFYFIRQPLGILDRFFFFFDYLIMTLLYKIKIDMFYISRKVVGQMANRKVFSAWGEITIMPFI
jgi:hypothetical protein